MSVVLRWREPVLTMHAGDETWKPLVDLVNDADADTEIGGPPAASGVLSHADGTSLKRRSATVVAIPSVLVRYRLQARQDRPLHVVVGLTPEEIAALEPGRYRISQVRWGKLTAADIDLEIRR